MFGARRKLLLAAVAAAAALPGTASAAMSESVFLARADTFVSSSGDTGPRAARLRLRRSPQWSLTYVGFKLPRTDASVVRATLETYSVTGSRAGYRVRAIWWADGSQHVSRILDRSGRLRSGQWASVAVTGPVRRRMATGGSIRFRLSTRSSRELFLKSRETRAKPRLVVDLYSPDPETPDTGTAPPSEPPPEPTPTTTTTTTTTTPTTTTPTTTTTTTTTTPTTTTTTSEPPPPPTIPDGPVRGEILGMASGYGQLAATSAERTLVLDDYRALGARWMRFDVTWATVEGRQDRYNWTTTDEIVDGALSRGLNVLGDIAYTPSWARPSGCTDKCPPTNLADYGEFVEDVVRRYAPQGVHHWEIWNEPNIVQFWQPTPNAAAYTALLKVGYEAVKRADPTAVVVSAGLSPAWPGGTNVPPVTFLQQMYANGAHGYFDALGYHPYNLPDYPTHPNPYSSNNFWYQMYGTNPSLRSLMEANGDGGKQIWGTEFGGPDAGAQFAYGETGQAQLLSEGYRLWNSYPWAGPLFWYSYRDRATSTGSWDDFSGLVRWDMAVKKPAYFTFQDLARAAQ